jgi:hypothetical protein
VHRFGHSNSNLFFHIRLIQVTKFCLHLVNTFSFRDHIPLYLLRLAHVFAKINLCIIIIPGESFADGVAGVGWPSAQAIFLMISFPTSSQREGLWCPISKNMTARVEHYYL